MSFTSGQPPRLRRWFGFLRWPVSSLRVYLAAVMVVSTVPLTGFVLYLLHHQAEEARVERQTSLYRLVNSLAQALEGELASSTEALHLLSHDEALQRGDLADFQRHLQRWPLARPNWSSVALADDQGRVLFSVPAAKHPLTAFPAATGEAPRVGSLRAAGGALSTTVEMPLQTPNARYLLCAVIDMARWQKLVDQVSVPQDAFVSLVDGKDRVIATNRYPERYVGQVLPIERLAQSLRGEASAPQPLLTLKQVAGTGWWVGAGLVGAGPAWADVAAMWSALTAGLASLGLGLVLALYVARRVCTPLRQLAHGGPGAVGQRIVVREIAALGNALEAADMERSRAMQALQTKADEFHALLQERLALVQREQDARHAAEEANRGKDEFLAMLGHELRNPLSAISAAVEVINRVDPQHESSKSARRIIARQTQQLVGLMNDLTDMARVSAGKITIGKQPVSLAQLVWRAHVALRVAGRFRDHALTLHLEHVTAEVDARRIEQVVSNLLTNAVKYTPAGGTITVTLGTANGQAELHVMDNGIGIPATLLPQVFDAFVQGERTAERRRGGLGLGLTLVRRMVELHGGDVQAASAGQGLGSRFTVRLPAAVANTTQPLHRPLVLVGLDDDALPVLEALLDEAPRRVAIMPDVAIALSSLRADAQLAGALVVVRADNLPVQAGAMLQAWRAISPGLRLVALGAVMEEGVLPLAPAAFDAVMPAPLMMESLQRELAEIHHAVGAEL